MQGVRRWSWIVWIFAFEKGIIYGTGAFLLGDAKKHVAFNQAYEMGKAV